jgi:hypothetical protein
MMKLINDACQKIKYYLTPKKHRLRKIYFDENDNIKYRIIEDIGLDHILYLAGIDSEMRHKAHTKAYHHILENQISIEMKKILESSRDFFNIQSIAQERAEADLINKEKAKIDATLMEKNTISAYSDIKDIEDKWEKHIKKSKNKKLTAKMFGDFLVKQKYLTVDQKDAVRTTALFFENKLTNALAFHAELKRVKQLY